MKNLRYIPMLAAMCLLLSCGDGAKGRQTVNHADSISQQERATDTLVQHVADTVVGKGAVKDAQLIKETCEEPYGDMESGFTTVCFYWNADLETAYAHFRAKNSDSDDGRFLESQWPKEAEHNVAGSYPIEVKYLRETSDRLSVNLFFPGGETQIVFEKKPKGVEVRTVHSPD
ncbi:hypothetical protein [Sphingobacterium bambusae]|uniref:Lipoprotein n=1 Tax=Sphingobacterium bambusae TaxID=662858 RepID=A0ABW6BCJ2_9SPHI|nr:hypothetical protein [Sphingobacterium bambusae]WPL49248.1 hypothetical protein SCB77_02070 [Sphingobacterium bambusae]